jgi:hypothetical protein
MTLPEATVAEFEHEQGGGKYKVLVLKQEFKPELPYFVGYMAGSQTLMISDDIPFDLRMYMLQHEISCMVIHNDEDNHCVHATVDEYIQVPEDRRAEYVQMRLAFYRPLVPYHVEKNSDPDLIAGIRGSLFLWEGWAKAA